MRKMFPLSLVSISCILPVQFLVHLLIRESLTGKSGVTGMSIILRCDLVLNVLGSLSELTVQLLLDAWQHLCILEGKLVVSVTN